MSWLQDQIKNPKLWTLFIERPETLYYTKYKVQKSAYEDMYANWVSCYGCAQPKRCTKNEEFVEEEMCIVFQQVQLKFFIENHNLQGTYYNRKDKMLLAAIGNIPYDQLFKELIMGTLSDGDEYSDMTEIDSKDIVSCQELAVECFCRTVFVEQYKAGVIKREDCKAKTDEKPTETDKNSNLNEKEEK